MSDAPKGELMVDSWEDLLENDTEKTLEKLNEAIEKIQIADKKTIDPFGSSSSKTRSGESDDGRFDGLRHLAVLCGPSIDAQEVNQRLKNDFGNNARVKQINDSNLLLIFANSIDARQAMKSAQKFLPSRLRSIDDPEFKHLDYVLDNAEQLKPGKTDTRPQTNMSMIRNTVTRHLNVKAPMSQQHIEEKEQLKRAREAKKAKADLWK